MNVVALERSHLDAHLGAERDPALQQLGLAASRPTGRSCNGVTGATATAPASRDRTYARPMTDDKRGAWLPSDEVTRQRKRLLGRFLACALPLMLVGMALQLLDVGPAGWQSIPMLLGLLILMTAWPIGAWHYPRRLGSPS